jgi:hypothetical protein
MENNPYPTTIGSWMRGSDDCLSPQASLHATLPFAYILYLSSRSKGKPIMGYGTSLTKGKENVPNLSRSGSRKARLKALGCHF